ncbi:MAG: iron-sulfur cluster assembly accessory protein [Candidatus Poribacteria bacterium]|nr:iron-sulfur cluster assembly accessory protein [Candidatus Poribacteria bacterium]
MITITDAAAKKALVLLGKAIEEEGSDSDKEYGLRMQVVGGGCSGFQYNLGFEAHRNGDKVFEHHGLKVFIDPRSTLYLAGSTLDYKDGLMESGFKITNPNATSTCGCGESFNV